MKPNKLSEKDKDLIRKTLIPQGMPESEVQKFFRIAELRNLDPLTEQIYIRVNNVKVVENGQQVFKKRYTIGTPVDSLRLIAIRSKDYSGQDEPTFQEDSTGKPIKCSVTVYRLDRTGFRAPVTVSVYWKEYVPASVQDFMWNKMPHTMLAKVAESQALRKAFPEDLGSLYSDEEIVDDQPVNQAPSTPAKPPVKTARQRAEEWLETVPNTILSINAADKTAQHDEETKKLLSQLEAGKKLVSNEVDLVKKFDDYISQLSPKKEESKPVKKTTKKAATYEEAKEIFGGTDLPE